MAYTGEATRLRQCQINQIKKDMKTTTNNTMKKTIMTTISAVVLSATAIAQNLVTNGDFEADTIIGGSANAIPSSWALLDPAKTVDIFSSGHEPAPHTGNFIDLIGDPGDSGGGISQAVSLTAGTTYTISFDYAGYSDTINNALTWNVGPLINGSLTPSSSALLNTMGAAANWDSYSTTFTAPTTGSYSDITRESNRCSSHNDLTVNPTPQQAIFQQFLGPRSCFGGGRRPLRWVPAVSQYARLPPGRFAAVRPGAGLHCVGFPFEMLWL